MPSHNSRSNVMQVTASDGGLSLAELDAHQLADMEYAHSSLRERLYLLLKDFQEYADLVSRKQQQQSQQKTKPLAHLGEPQD